MSSKKNNAEKTTDKSVLAEQIIDAEKRKSKNPPGLDMPLEKEMTPPQFG